VSPILVSVTLKVFKPVYIQVYEEKFPPQFSLKIGSFANFTVQSVGDDGKSSQVGGDRIVVQIEGTLKQIFQNFSHL
jgi:hypothetical protein